MSLAINYEECVNKVDETDIPAFRLYFLLYAPKVPHSGDVYKAGKFVNEFDSFWGGWNARANAAEGVGQWAAFMKERG